MVFLIGILMLFVLDCNNVTVEVIHPFTIIAATFIMAAYANYGEVMRNRVDPVVTDNEVFRNTTKTTTHFNKNTTYQIGFGGVMKYYIVKERKISKLSLLSVNEN
jgi:hypothetical protein